MLRLHLSTCIKADQAWDRIASQKETRALQKVSRVNSGTYANSFNNAVITRLLRMGSVRSRTLGRMLGCLVGTGYVLSPPRCFDNTGKKHNFWCTVRAKNAWIRLSHQSGLQLLHVLLARQLLNCYTNTEMMSHLHASGCNSPTRVFALWEEDMQHTQT